MCYRPITISNPARVKNEVFSKSQIEVPCGHCPQCKDTKRLSWFVRLYYEWQYCVNNGGFGLFITLTYNNVHLPKCLTDYSLFMGGQGISCYSVRDCQLYFKNVRSDLQAIYPNVDIAGKVKYFLSMEYGSINTHRPHYHLTWFVSTNEIDPQVFKRIARENWIENGFIKFGKLNGGFICNVGGLNYCAKYVCKDIYEDDYLRKKEYWLLKLGFKKEEFKDIYPRVLQSKNLGVSALEFDDYNDLDNFFEGVITLPDKDNITRTYKLPLYYERKIFYDIHYRYFDDVSKSYISVTKYSDLPAGVDFTPIYVLNELGLEMKEKRAQKTLDAVTNVYRIVVSLPEFTDLLVKFNEKFNTKFETIKDFISKIKRELPEPLFVSYSLVYRGCHIHQEHHQSPCGSTPYYDYMLINDMTRGVRPLSVDYDNLCSNIDYFNNIPNVEDNYQMIRYMFKLIHAELEHEYNRKELEYVEQKSAYIAQTENIV